ncbi:MAG: EscU/YscU/HrcU family type III secretion system export apparatus switch protein [Sphingomonas sp.]
MAEQEQNRSEEPTPFKLKRGREKGMVARSAELGFLGALVALAAFVAISGPALAGKLAQAMRRALSAGAEGAAEPQALVGELYWSALEPLLLLGGTIVAVVLLLEMLQLRGLVFTAHPLKPDFSRLNPAKGLKRLFSPRMLKETLKTLLKTGVYCAAAWWVLRDSVGRFGEIAGDGERLAAAMGAAGLRLVLVFAAIAVGFVILDLVLVRGEFLKQMRMSRREVTRETKDREGDPRLRSRRRQLHAEYASQSRGIGDLAGSDLVIANPEHFAVALRYDPERMSAPTVSAKGRNRFALALREEAFRLGIPVLVRPGLARALFRGCAAGAELSAQHYEAVAELYIELRRGPARPEPAR